MKTTTRKLVMGLGSICVSYLLGTIMYFVFYVAADFSSRSKFIPAVFTVGMLILLGFYLLYWSKAKKNPNLKGTKVLCCALGCFVCVLCLVLAFLLFSDSVYNQVAIALFIYEILLVIGQICAYVLGEVKIGG